MPSQQQKPIKRGLPPLLTSFTILLFNPIAAIASTMKNLLSSFTGSKKETGMPKEPETVVMTEASIKYRIKKGKTFLNRKPPSCFAAGDAEASFCAFRA